MPARAFARACGRVARVVGTNDDGDIALREFRVDFIHLDELLVRNVGLSQEDIHVPGHSASNWVNGVLDLGIELLFQQITEFFT